MSKTYRAVVEPNEDGRAWDHEDAVTMDRMELLFTIGDRAETKFTPDALVIDLLRQAHLSRFMWVTSVEQIEAAECIGLRPAPGSPELEPEPEVCPVCRKEHGAPEVVGANGVRFWPDHEYIIRTRHGAQKYPREWRMGYLGFGAGMQFSARGPDRTHGGQYGGTQNFDLQHIIYAEEVERDDAKRHVGRIIK